MLKMPSEILKNAVSAAFLVAIISPAAWAGAELEEPCSMKLLGEASSSQTISFYVENELRGELNEVTAIIAEAAKQVGCQKPQELELRPQTLSCKTLVPAKKWTKVCYVEAKGGYFMISKDFVDTVNVTFNRWD